MAKKSSVEELAIFGGTSLFATPKSTSNLQQPDFEKFMGYSKLFFDQHQYTNNGPNVKLLEKRLADFHQAEYCVTFCSGFWAIALVFKMSRREVARIWAKVFVENEVTIKSY